MKKPNLSITLPRNFTFHYIDGGPKTPENKEPEPPRLPSPPPAYRVRRRIRPNITPYHPRYRMRQSQDVPVPTIEAPVPVRHSASLGRSTIIEPIEGLIAPPRSPGMACPKTPLAQIVTEFENLDKDRVDWGVKGEPQPGDSISRPDSACSMFSDSSIDSRESYESVPYASGTGSCTSPESDALVPFKFPFGSKTPERTALDASPQTVQLDARGKLARKHKSTRWTAEMDKHLWATYQMYLQDPTVTPFKMLPGTAPPLGVCSRVARQARRSWRGINFSAAKGPDVLRDVMDEAHAVPNTDSPKTIRVTESGNTTPTGLDRNTTAIWPRSGGATRRRLRDLCKYKPSLAPHYQRLLSSRTATPFSQSRSGSSSSRVSMPVGGPSNPLSFATRDLQFSLVTSTAATMQPNGPLAQLYSDETEQKKPDEDDSFNRPVDHGKPEKNQPLQLGLGIGGLTGPARLGSPFNDCPEYITSDFHAHARPTGWRTRSDGMAIAKPRVKYPPRHVPYELSSELQPLPYDSPKLPSLPGTMKRRAQHQLEDELSPGGTDFDRDLDDRFGEPAEGSRRRVRSRGFSLGDIGAGAQLTDLFTPPTVYDQMYSSEFADTPSFGSTAQPPAAPEQIRRLGSPFAGFESMTVGRSAFSRHRPSFSTFPRSSSPFSQLWPELRRKDPEPENLSQEPKKD